MVWQTTITSRYRLGLQTEKKLWGEIIIASKRRKNGGFDSFSVKFFHAASAGSVALDLEKEESSVWLKFNTNKTKAPSLMSHHNFLIYINGTSIDGPDQFINFGSVASADIGNDIP